MSYVKVCGGQRMMLGVFLLHPLLINRWCEQAPFTNRQRQVLPLNFPDCRVLCDKTHPLAFWRYTLVHFLLMFLMQYQLCSSVYFLKTPFLSIFYIRYCLWVVVFRELDISFKFIFNCIYVTCLVMRIEIQITEPSQMAHKCL